MTDWWQEVEHLLKEVEAEAPDPWGEPERRTELLTTEQLAFLDQLASQPAPGHLDDELGLDQG
jgi:hypothetical protein